jgi:Protein of unknown function (DUF4236)/Bacterial SH3 domain
MGFRFRKSVKILPGVRLNFGKKGCTSTTIGGKFFKTNVSNRGVKHTFSVPGTGVSYQTKTYKNAPANYGSANSNAQLYWDCANCHTANLPDRTFCYKCSGNYVPNPQQQQPVLGSKDGRNLFIILGSVFGLIFIAAFINAIVNPSPRSTTTQSYSPSPVRPSSENSVSPSTSKVESPKTTEPKTLNSTKTSSAKKAVVITENANLRKAANSNGEVIQTISEGTNIEIVKQQGAWFLVKANNQTGWMHGNTIRLVDAENLSSNSSTNDNTYANSYNSSSYYSSPYSGSSSSTYDYRPKTVRVGVTFGRM